ncbi:MAG TPA: ABC transporter substrate-binding protein [Pseudomonadales bacterium]|nr:ABC transporter substrate-binding protein [Pseudomonadales bacterium]
MWKSMLALFAGALLCGAVRADASDPTAVIQTATNSLIKVINDGKTYFDKDPDRFYSEIQKVLDPTVDFGKFAQGVMAVYYKRATTEQRERFQSTFKTGLVRTYGKALLDFGDEKIDVLPPSKPREQPDRDTVKMEIHSKDGKIYPVLYSMRLCEDGQWRMYNILINGINMGITYRNQFASAMKAPENKGNLDMVIAQWAETIAHIDPAKQGNPDGSTGASTEAAGDE